MSTWWRQSRDSFGKTIPQRLTFDTLLLEEAIAARNIERDKEWISWARSHIKRIRSILRRLKICSHCRGKRIVPIVRVKKKHDRSDYTWKPCPVCSGSGRIKEGRMKTKLPRRLPCKNIGGGTNDDRTVVRQIWNRSPIAKEVRT